MPPPFPIGGYPPIFSPLVLRGHYQGSAALKAVADNNQLSSWLVSTGLLLSNCICTVLSDKLFNEVNRLHDQE